MRVMLKRITVAAAAGFCILACATWSSISTPNLSLRGAASPDHRFSVLDRRGTALGISYQNAFNLADARPLHDIPDLLRHAIVTAEDRRFFEHKGIDWRARGAAVWQNLKARKIVRGASTITEQVVRILNPRPRTLWSRWIEGFEAMALERQANKGEILAFYLNQVPYAAKRRGVAQAARYYFNRDLTTLTDQELLALAVLPRAPTSLDPYRRPTAIASSLQRLVTAMEQRGELKTNASLQAQTLTLARPAPLPNASHFVSYIRETVSALDTGTGVLRTSLDGALQAEVQTLVDERLKTLRRKKVTNGAALVVDHTTGEILAWVVAGATSHKPVPGGTINAVRVPRQPGSSLKPFLYASALDLDWSPATILDDAPMSEAIGSGLHDFRNYSHTFYGKISLREALGNSLNIPALETIAFVTPQRYLDRLHRLGFTSLTKEASFYKDGLALGNGEVSLFEMVQAFSALANHGQIRPLTPLAQSTHARETKQVFSEEAASLIGNILSDPFARRREFGLSSVLNLPTQTAVKTGTSTDYRDAWVLGYNSRYTVGIWFGNLDQTPMDGVTGSTGPALTLRAIFAELETRHRGRRLWLSPKLVRREICSTYGPAGECYTRSEYFMPGTVQSVAPSPPSGLDLLRPTEGLQIAYDPRIPQDVQAFEFVADGFNPGHKVNWILNGANVALTDDGRWMWPVERGSHTILAQEIGRSGEIVSAKTAHFIVK